MNPFLLTVHKIFFFYFVSNLLHQTKNDKNFMMVFDIWMLSLVISLHTHFSTHFNWNQFKFYVLNVYPERYVDYVFKLEMIKTVLPDIFLWICESAVCMCYNIEQIWIWKTVHANRIESKTINRAIWVEEHIHNIICD